MMRKSTSLDSPPSRKTEPAPAPPDDHVPPRWSDDDLRRVLALSTLGVIVLGAAWLTWRSTWLLWPAGLCALVLQASATMIAARSAVESRERPSDVGRPDRQSARAAGHRRSDRAGQRDREESILSILIRLLLPSDEDESGDAADGQAQEQDASSLLSMPAVCPAVHDATLHRAFFRRIVEAEFAEHLPGLVWPDLGNLQGSLSTRLRLFQRHASCAPVAAHEISEDERTGHSPWAHLAALEATEYRRGDTLARLSHRAFAPLAFLELHARLDMEQAERESLEVELGRLYTVGYGRILTPPTMLSAAEPLRDRMGGPGAIALADDARLALRSAGSLEDAERVRGEWRVRARAQREVVGWSSEVQSMVECLIDYWLVQRAAAADLEWAEELARLEGCTIGAALAQRDAGGGFHFADALRLVCGASGAQGVEPTAARTVA